MRTLVTMHQPNYLPWIGLFSKVKQADCFVIMDTFQYPDTGVTHRNKIRTNVGTGYLTIPINKQFARARICEVELPEDRKWQEVHWQTIYRNYVKTDFFKNHKDFFERLYKKQMQYLCQINVEIIRYLLDSFKIDVEVLMASDLKISQELKHTDMIIEVLKRIGGKVYLSGPSGKGYLETDSFTKNGLDYTFVTFSHPTYKQRYPGFEPNLSAIDLLFNVGPESAGIIEKSGGIEE
jgi:hypothetical protein